MKWSAAAALAVAALAAAWSVPARLALLGVVIVLLLQASRGTITIRPRVQAAVVAALFGFCLLAVPFWNLPAVGTAGRIGAALLLLTASVVVPLLVESCGTGWTFALPARAAALYAGAYGLAAIVLYTALRGSLTYYGDSDTHTFATIALTAYFSHWQTLVPVGAAVVCLTWFVATGRRRALAGASVGFLAAGFVAVRSDVAGTWFLRYPILFYYLNAVIAVPLYAWHNRGFAFQEGFFRLAPFAAAIGVAVVTACAAQGRRWSTTIAVLLAVMTLPTLAFFGTVTYLELPLVVATLAALLAADADLTQFQERGVIGVTFVMLLITSFLKETALIGLAVFMAFAAWRVLRDHETPAWLRLWRLSTLAIILFSPVVLFLAFHPKGRPYAPNLSNLWTLGEYRIVLRSWWEQFGLFVVVAPIAWVYCWRRGLKSWCLLTAAFTTAYVGFFLIDGPPTQHFRFEGSNWLGNARYNLHVMPVLLVVTARAASLLDRPALILTASIALTVVNLFLSPVRPGSANRGLFWGDYTMGANDLNVPYDEVYAWLADHPEYRRVLVLGRSYSYEDPFYFMKYRIQMSRLDDPRGVDQERSALERLDEYDLLLYQQERFRDNVPPPEVARLSALRDFETDAVRVVAYAVPRASAR